MIYLLLAISANTNGHLHDSDLPGHERDMQEEKKKARKVVMKLPQGLSLTFSANVGTEGFARKGPAGYVLGRWDCEHGKG